MVETELLTRFLQSGASVAVVEELRDNLIVERLEQQTKKTTQTLLNQFFEALETPTEIIDPDVAIPIFFLGKLLQKISLGKTNSLRNLQGIVSGYIQEFDLERVRKELMAAEAPPSKTELVASILRIIRALLEGI